MVASSRMIEVTRNQASQRGAWIIQALLDTVDPSMDQMVAPFVERASQGSWINMTRNLWSIESRLHSAKLRSIIRTHRRRRRPSHSHPISRRARRYLLNYEDRRPLWHSTRIHRCDPVPTRRARRRRYYPRKAIIRVRLLELTRPIWIISR